MLAEIIAIGSELTCGSKLDTNSQWLSREVEALGWTVARHTTLSDDIECMVTEFRVASQRAQVVLITGGLGPTLDDITRDALARAFDQPLVRDPESLRQIEAIFAARGRAMPERNVRQADRPEQSEALPNSCGTAPGILMRVHQFGTGDAGATCLFAVMPGVPAEMKLMFELQVKPHLMNSGSVLCRRVIRTFGYGESDAEQLLGDLTARGRNPEVGITASEAVISLWITARSLSDSDAAGLCEDTCRLIRERLGNSVYAEGDLELHEVVGGLLGARGQKIALIEGSTTGGLLSMWLTESKELISVVDRTIHFPGHWQNPAITKPPVRESAAVNHSEDWIDIARVHVEAVLRCHSAEFVLFSSPFEDSLTDSGVSVRRGLVGIAAPGVFETVDVSMSGNLSIFRQRAARTALHRLRLLLAELLR